MESAQYQTVPFFLFDTLWPLTKLYQINGGNFPCYKVTDEQNGRIFLKPMGTLDIFKRYGLFILFTLVLKTLTFMTMWLTWNGLTYSEISQVLEKHGQSKLDFATFYSVLILSLVGHIVIVFRNMSYKDQLAKLQGILEHPRKTQTTQSINDFSKQTQTQPNPTKSSPTQSQSKVNSNRFKGWVVPGLTLVWLAGVLC